MSSLFNEFRRRNLFRVAGLYAAGAWVIIQLGIAFETSLELPGWFDRLLTTLMLAGFPVALLCAWQFEITPSGVRRTKPLPEQAAVPRFGMTAREIVFATICVVFMGLIGWQVIRSEADRRIVPPSVTALDAVSVEASVEGESAREALSEPERPTFDPTSVVVLPFENLSGDPELDYIATGMSASLRDSLAQNRAIRVVARSSSNAVARDGLSAEEIADRLSVSKVVEGRLERRLGAPGTEMGADISVSLTDAQTGYTRWTATEAVEDQDMLALRDRFVSRVTQSLSQDARIELTGLGEGSRPGAPSVPEAYEAYLKADTALAEEATLESIERARAYLERAARLDPGYSDVQVKLGEVYLVLGTVSSDTGTARAYLDKSVAAARRAVELAPDDPDALTTLGTVLMTGRLDIAAASEPFAQMATAISPPPNALMRHAVYLSATGKHADAVSQAMQAYELDPLDAAAAETLAFAHYAARDYEAAARHFRESLVHNPDRYTTRARLGLSLIRLGEVETGEKACEEEANLMEALPCLAAAAMARNSPADAQAAFDRLVETYGDAGAYQQAEILGEMGRFDDALRTLELAESLRDTGLTLAGFDPALDGLRGNKSFEDMLARLGLAQ